MLEKVHKSRTLQLMMGLAIGFCFGFLLQKVKGEVDDLFENIDRDLRQAMAYFG